MNPFLRRVVERRDREAFLAAEGLAALEEADNKRLAHLDALVGEELRHCRLCGVRLVLHEAATTPQTVCTRCGGRKKQAQLEAQDTAREAERRRLDVLLQCAGIPPRGTMAKSDEAKMCSRPGCGKTLRSNNSTGECGSGCLSPEAPPAKRASAVGGGADVGRDYVKDFRTVARALGEDPDALLSDFARGWLERVRGAVRREGDVA